MTAFLNSAKGLIRSFVGTMPPADMEGDREKTGLFKDCNFVVVRSAKLDEQEAEKVCVVSPMHDLADFVS